MKNRLVTLTHKNQQAWIYPEQGFQLYQYQQDFGGGLIATIVKAPEGFVEPADRRYGNPILFPSPSRTHGVHGLDTWVWNQKTLFMPFHGFARNLYWKIIDQKADRITGELAVNSSAAVCFPFEYHFRVTYTLGDSGLVLDAEVQNKGSDPFPYALGFHPYFKTPVGPKGTPGDCKVSLPQGVRLTTTDEWKTHSGSPFSAATLPCNTDLSASCILTGTGAKKFDIHDPANGLVSSISVEKSEQDFPVWVIWNATPEVGYLCIEPWTDSPNALNRPETRRCPAGTTHRYQMAISARKN